MSFVRRCSLKTAISAANSALNPGALSLIYESKSLET